MSKFAKMDFMSELIINKHHSMPETHNSKKKSYLLSVVQLKCNHCREGNLFQTKSSYAKGFMKMNDTCPVCGHPTEIESGFYYGTGYLSYAIAIAFSVATFVAWYVMIGFSVNDNRVFYWLGLNALLLILLQPYLMRLSRSMWFSFFVKYDKNWKENKQPIQLERVNENLKNNW